MSTITATPLQAFKIAIFLAAYDNGLSDAHDDHYGTELNVDLQNAVADYASIAVEVDVREDEVWTAYCDRATDTEINNFTINKLMAAFSAQIPDTKPLFIVALKQPDLLDSWKTHVVESPTLFDFMATDELIDNAYWSKTEVELIANCGVGRMLQEFGDQRHTLIRLK